MDAKDILYAWRDFECSYFASALLGPKTPFRQFLTRYAYSIDVGNKIDLSTTLIMRRMSSVSPYPHWHYFDAYPPGNLRAVYRGNGIPLPWGNMRMVLDPCQHWAVFKMLNTRSTKPSAQISVLRSGSDARLYCCQSIRSKDAAGNAHVLCGGIDLAPALRSQGFDADEIIAGIEKSCNRSGGTGQIPPDARRKLESVSKILNIGWVADGAGGTLTGYTTNIDPAFTLTIDADGNYTFTLYAPLKHPETDDGDDSNGVETSWEDNLSLAFNFTITDNDDDTVAGTLTFNGDDDSPDTCGDDRLGARWGASVVGARLERHVGGCSPRRRPCPVQCHCFRVRSSARGRPAAADHPRVLALALHDETSH